MKQIMTHTINLQGSNYEIGRQLGRRAAANPVLKAVLTASFDGFHADEAAKAAELFDRWCPGLTEELTGFADVLGVSPDQIYYSAMTYLHPNCSHMGLLPQMTENGHPLLARNYEFNDNMEEFLLAKTSVNGKYTHLGTCVLNFGREDGFNDQGLAVTMSSCGFPVGAVKDMRRPVVTGLQYWAVIRSLLENCRDVDEAIDFLKGMPIAYNLNMILMDKHGHAALLETLDGSMACKKLTETDEIPYLYATNHALIKELAAREPQAMNNSLLRCQWIENRLKDRRDVSREELKTMLLSQYPDGLCCHYYEDFFGTTKSMVIDPVDGTIDLCWGGRQENGWRRYDIHQPMADTDIPAELSLERADPEMFTFVPMNMENLWNI